MIAILLSLLGWGFLFWYAHNHPIEDVSFAERGGGGGDEAPAPPPRPTPEQIFASSGRLQELDQMLRQYIGKSLNAPSEWGTQGDIYQQLLGYTPEQFKFPTLDIQRALEAQRGLQYEN